MSLNHLSYTSKYEIPYLKGGPTGPTGPQGPTGPTGPRDPNPNFESATIDGIPVATEDYVNNKWNTLGAWQAPVLSKTKYKPETIAAGDRFLIDEGSPDLDWVDFPNCILTYEDENYFIVTEPVDGMVVFAQDTDYIWLYNGTEWVRLSIQVDHNAMLGIQGGTIDERYHIDATTASNLAGLTSPVQSQLNSKLGLTGGTLTGPLKITPSSIDVKKIVFFETNANSQFNYSGIAASTYSYDFRARYNNSFNFRISNDTDTASDNVLTVDSSGIIIRAAGVITGNRVATINSFGRLVSSTVTTTQLDYLSGATSNIQTQLNDKLPKQDPNILGQLQLNGTGSGTTPLQFTNTGGIKSSGPIRVTSNVITPDTKKIVLWEDNEATTYKYYGLGLSPNSLDYRSVGLTGTHNWYTSSNDGNTSLQLMSLGRHSLQVKNMNDVYNPIADIQASGSRFINSNGSVSLANSAYFGSGIVIVNTENTASQKRCDIGIDTNGDVVFRVGNNNFNQPIAMWIRNNRAIEFPALTATRVPIIDANRRLAVSNVTPTELGYLSGTTSNIQTQLNNKMDAGLVSPTELSYLSGVTSSIQAQLNNKMDVGSVSPLKKVIGRIAVSSGELTVEYMYPPNAMTASIGGTYGRILSLVPNTVSFTTPPVVTIGETFDGNNLRISILFYIDTIQFWLYEGTSVQSWSPSTKNIAFMFSIEGV